MRTIAFAISLTVVVGCLPDEDGGGDAANDPQIPTPADGEEPGSDSLDVDLEESTCLPGEAMETFGLCLCDSFNLAGRLEILRSEEDLPASVGVNGYTQLVAEALVEGSWHGHEGINAVMRSTIESDVITTGTFQMVGQQTVGGDLIVGQDVFGAGTLDVGGALRVDGQVMVAGQVSSGSKGVYEAPAAPPCACDGDGFFDVATAVDDARNLNDNDAIGLSEDGVLAVGMTELVLPTGRYYIDDITTVGGLQLLVEGNVALYVGGSMMSVGTETIELADGATLDLYVAGSVLTVGNVVTGSLDQAADFRLLIGGGQELMISVGEQRFFGHIYAPRATLAYVGDTEIHGSLFANRLVGAGTVKIHHASASTPPDEVCDGEVTAPR